LVVLFFFFCANSCAGKPQVKNNFYSGLSGVNSVPSFEKALSDSNPYIRKAAAQELADLMYQEGNREPRTFGTMVRRPSGSVGVDYLMACIAVWQYHKSFQSTNGR